MPILTPTYKPKFYFKSGFVSTVYSGLVRKVNIEQERERLTLIDGDFIDLDWSFSAIKTDACIILLHGLEGHAQRPYLTGAAKLFNANNIDAVSVNFRGCSGEINSKFRSYHSGETQDLVDVITHLISEKKYTKIYLKGISLGANVILKYLGERDSIPKEVKAAVAISAPCDLNGACEELHRVKNMAFSNRFLKHLKASLKKKIDKFPNNMSIESFNSIKTLRDFDNIYTSKAHGFIDGADYYKQCSSLQFLPNIKTPTLIINALNDSFLSPECYPVREAKHNENLFLEMPEHGGHVGFIDRNGVYYNERRALEFIQRLES
jgi:predicted alpha/beta-fold hydrolase